MSGHETPGYWSQNAVGATIEVRMTNSGFTGFVVCIGVVQVGSDNPIATASFEAVVGARIVGIGVTVITLFARLSNTIEVALRRFHTITTIAVTEAFTFIGIGTGLACANGRNRVSTTQRDEDDCYA